MVSLKALDNNLRETMRQVDASIVFLVQNRWLKALYLDTVFSSILLFHTEAVLPDGLEGRLWRLIALVWIRFYHLDELLKFLVPQFPYV